MNASNASTICNVLVLRGFLSKLGRVREANGKRVPPPPLHLHRLSLLSFTRDTCTSSLSSVIWQKSAGKGRESKVKFTRGVGTVSTELLQRTEVTSLWLLWVFFSLSLALSYSQAGISWRLRTKYEVLVFDEVLTGTEKNWTNFSVTGVKTKCANPRLCVCAPAFHIYIATQICF